MPVLHANVKHVLASNPQLASCADAMPMRCHSKRTMRSAASLSRGLGAMMRQGCVWPSCEPSTRSPGVKVDCSAAAILVSSSGSPEVAWCALRQTAGSSASGNCSMGFHTGI